MELSDIHYTQFFHVTPGKASMHRLSNTSMGWAGLTHTLQPAGYVNRIIAPFIKRTLFALCCRHTALFLRFHTYGKCAVPTWPNRELSKWKNVLRVESWLVLTAVTDWSSTGAQRKMGNTADENWLRLKGHVCHGAMRGESLKGGVCESLLLQFVVFERHAKTPRSSSGKILI